MSDWAETFSVASPTHVAHVITTRPAEAFDGGDWWRSACSCGKYTSGLWASPGRAEQAGRDHANAKSRKNP